MTSCVSTENSMTFEKIFGQKETLKLEKHLLQDLEFIKTIIST